MPGVATKQSTSSTVGRLALVGLHNDKPGVRYAVLVFRRSLEAEATERGLGGIHVTSRIHTASLALRRHLLAELRLKEGAADLSLADWMNLSDRSLKWKETVDRCLMVLGLDKRATKDVWAEVYNGSPQLPAARQGQNASASGPDHASAGSVDPGASAQNLDHITDTSQNEGEEKGQPSPSPPE